MKDILIAAAICCFALLGAAALMHFEKVLEVQSTSIPFDTEN